MKKIILPLLFILITITGRGQMMPMPFYEPWDMGTFTFQDWTFYPAQENWQIDLTEGNPWPSAVFHGQPVLTDYSSRLTSVLLLCGYHYCSKFWLEFDLKLDNAQNTGTEAFGIVLRYNMTWHNFDSVYNINSFGWTHFKYQLPDGLTLFTGLQIGFIAHGPNSSGINGWYLDNIHVYFTCNPPVSVTGMNMGSYNHITWQPPPCLLDTTGRTMIPMGYNVYRKSCTETTYQKLNSTYIADTTFDDHFSSGSCFDYYITICYLDTETMCFLCESVTTDTLLLMYEGVNQQNRSGDITLFPNPVDKKLIVKCKNLIQGFQFIDLSGRKVFEADKILSKDASLICEGLDNGIYFVRIRTVYGELYRKVIVQH